MAANVALQLYPCKICGRKFVQESLDKHVKACAKVSKPRKVFDSAKQRVTEDLPLRQIKQAQKKVVSAPKSNWRAKHEDFINSIRAARDITKAQSEGRPLPPPPPPSINPDYVQCPYCSRRFNEKAAERHIPFCKEQSLKKGTIPRPNPAAVAKQQIRTQYQAPRPRVASNTSGGTPMASSSGNRSGVSRTPAAGMESRYSDFESGASYVSPVPPADGQQLSSGKDSASSRIPKKEKGQNKLKKMSSFHMRHHQRNQEGARNTLSPIDGQSPSRSKRTKSDSMIKTPTAQNITSLAKFCHNCGTRYYVATAKFCCECGIGRIGIS